VRNDELAGFESELAAVESLVRRLPAGPEGEVWLGDDVAVVRAPSGPLLLAADTTVEGVHVDLSVTTAADMGWKALARNVSDLAAMGGRPLHALVTVTVPAGRGHDLARLYDGLQEASAAYACPIVGGDLTSGPALVVTVAVTGTVDGDPVLRTGARPGDAILVTGPLGGASADLRAGIAGRTARPQARVEEGASARRSGATAMIDLSDGLALDLRRLAAASGVGVVVTGVPVADGASLDDAHTGGEDHELLFTVPEPDVTRAAFASAGLRPPSVIGHCTGDGEIVGLPEGGWRHEW
jgi:thiamine-monophosphate kinase